MKLKAVDSRYTPWVDRIRATASLRRRRGWVPRGELFELPGAVEGGGPRRRRRGSGETRKG